MLPDIPENVRKEMKQTNWKKVASIEWLVEDWEDWYEGVAFALWKIARRHKNKKENPAIDFQI